MGRELVQFKGKRPGPRTFFIIAASGARPVAQTAKTAATAVTGARNSAGCTRIKARRPLMLTPSPGCRRMPSGMTRTVPAGRGVKNCRRRCRRRCSRQFRGRSAAIPRQFRGNSEAIPRQKNKSDQRIKKRAVSSTKNREASEKTALWHSVFHRHPQQAVFAGDGGPLV